MWNGRGHRGVVAATLAVALAMLPSISMAAINLGTGDIAGDGSALVDSDPIDISATANALKLVKKAYYNGSVLPDTATVPKGSKVEFLIFVDNTSSIPISDVSIQDALDSAAYTYTANSIQIDNSYNCTADPCDATDIDAIYAAVKANLTGCSGVACTDANSDDVMSYDGAAVPNPIVHAGDQVDSNSQLDIVANNAFAMLFEVTVN